MTLIRILMYLLAYWFAFRLIYRGVYHDLYGMQEQENAAAYDDLPEEEPEYPVSPEPEREPESYDPSVWRHERSA